MIAIFKLTEARWNPHIACGFFFASTIETLDIIALTVLLAILRPRKRHFEHSCRANEPITTSPLSEGVSST